MQKKEQEETELGTKYVLFDKELYVKYVDKVEFEGRYIYGQTRNELGKVYVDIATKDEKGNKLSKDVIETTLRHELYHVIFDTLYFKESENETLVEWLAKITLILNKQGLKI